MAQKNHSHKSSAVNQVRIIGGTYRSRILRFPSSIGLRPTGDRIRETVFNWLGQSLLDQRCLDLFAGSGALSFEAASRGAARVLGIESERTVYRALTASRQLLACETAEFINADARAWLQQMPREQFDVVFCDPPFAASLHDAVLASLIPHLASGARVYVEAPTPIDTFSSISAHYQILKSARAGAVYFALVSPALDASRVATD